MRTEDMTSICVETLRSEVLANAEDYIDENFEDAMAGQTDMEDAFHDMFYEGLRDVVSGNDNGSYTMSRLAAKHNMLPILDTGEMSEMAMSLSVDVWDLIQNADWEELDVCFRLYLLDDMYDELFEYFKNCVEVG